MAEISRVVVTARPITDANYVLDVQNPTVWQNVIPRLRLNVNGDGLAQPFARSVEVVA